MTGPNAGRPRQRASAYSREAAGSFLAAGNWLFLVMRRPTERCASIDEAADIKDRAAALQAYARQRDDRDLEVWMAEIKLRASVRIGELVRELETAEGFKGNQHEVLPDSGKKQKAITDAGLSPSTAYRYQELAGTADERGMAAGHAAAEAYFATARAEREPATMEGLRGAVRATYTATIVYRHNRPPCRSPQHGYLPA